MHGASFGSSHHSIAQVTIKLSLVHPNVEALLHSTLLGSTRAAEQDVMGIRAS